MANTATLTHLEKATTYSVAVWTHDGKGRLSPATTASFTTNAPHQKNGTYEGRVTDVQGDPLANVALTLNNFATDTTTRATTGTDGRFALVLPQGEYFIDFDGSQATGGASDSVGYVGNTVVADITASRTTHRPDIVLQRGAVVTGRVTDTSGNPLGGVRAYLADVYPYIQEESNTGLILFFDFGPLPSAVTAADGTYTIKGAPMTALRVCSEPASGTSESPRYLDTCASTSVDPAPGSTTAMADIQLASRPGAELSGTVESPSGVGIPGVSVYVSKRNGLAGATQQTAGDGSYDIRGLPAGKYHVCYDSEFAMDDSATGYLSKCRAADITVTAGQHRHADARLAPASAVTGTVTDAAGRPLAGVQVSIQHRHSPFGGAFGGATTDARGQYTVKGLPAGSYRACFDPEFAAPVGISPGGAPGCRPARFATRIGLVRTGIDARLGVGGAMSGTVTNSDGTPVRYAEIDVESLTHPLTGFGFAQTNKHGRYTLRGLSAGNYRVCFSLINLAGPQREFCRHTKVTVRLGRFTRHIDEMLAAMARIAVSVRDAGGHAIAGADVAVLARCKRDHGFNCDHVSSFDASLPVTVRASATTDARGRIDFTQLPPGRYAVCVFGFYGAPTVGSPPNGYADTCTGGSFDLDATGGSTHAVSTTLADAGAVTGVITDGAGHPLRGVVVHVSNSAADDFQSPDFFPEPANPISYSVTGADGTYRVRSVAAGDQTVCVDAAQAKGGTSAAGYLDQCVGGSPGRSTGGTTVTVTSGASTSVPDLALTGGAGISGTVTSSNGKRARWISAVVFNAKGRALLYGQTNGKGNFEAVRLPAGPVRVCFETDVEMRCYRNVVWNGRKPPASATPVTLKAGTITSGIDIRLKT